MGNSKIVMLSGIYLIVGMYNLSFHSADKKQALVVESVANTIQAEQLAKTGIGLAVAKMGSDAALSAFPQEIAVSMEGTIQYSAEQPIGFPATQSKISATGIFMSDTVNVQAVVSYDRGRWRIVRLYIPPSA